VQVDVPVATTEERRRTLLVVVVAGVLRGDLTRDESAQYAVGAGDQHGVRREVDEFTVTVVQLREQRRSHAERGVETGFVVGQEPSRALQRRQRPVGMAWRVVSPA